jgi:rhodanese-related sulfurtransferase
MKKTIVLMMSGLLLFGACAKPVQVSHVANSPDPLQDIKQTVRNKFPAVQQLSTDELAAWQKEADREKPLLLDARTPEEFSVSHLQGAVNAGDTAQLEAMLKNHPKDKPIVAYCSIGYRSSVLAEQLMQQGFTNVVNLEGSIFQWANEGRPVYKGTELAQQVHPYDAKWGQMLKPEVRAPLP